MDISAISWVNFHRSPETQTKKNKEVMASVIMSLRTATVPLIRLIVYL